MSTRVPSVPAAAVPMDVDGTLINSGPGVLYYRDEPPVDESTKDGTIASGSSVGLVGTVWLVSDAAGCSVVAVPSVPQSTNAAGAILTEDGDPEPDPSGYPDGTLWVEML